MAAPRQTDRRPTVLLVDSDAAYAANLTHNLRERFDLHAVADATQARDHFLARNYDAVRAGGAQFVREAVGIYCNNHPA